MAKVIGIGGIFIKFKNPEAMRAWYRDVLGMITNDYGVLFEFNGENQRKGYLQLGTFEESTNYFGSDQQQTMLNFRIDNVSEMLNHLQSRNVTIVDEIEVYEYGKFLHIEDPEGNRIELWEPVDVEFEKSDDPKMSMQ